MSDEKNKQESQQVNLEGHLAQIYAEWQQTHRGQKAPLYIAHNGKPAWQNRKERRAQAKRSRSRT